MNEPERTADIAQTMIEAESIPPTDSLPDDPGQPWLTIPEIEALPTYREGLRPITTGFAVLDQALRGGFRPESLYIIAGRTGFAKSTLAANITRRVALMGHSVLLAKLEESPAEAVWRIHAAAAQIDMVRLLDGALLIDEERERYTDGLDLIRELPIRITDERRLHALEHVCQQHAEQRGELVVIDQLSMIDVPDADIGYQQATRASNTLRLLARRLRIPIVLIAQINRAASRNPKDRLTCNDLRDSGALENDAAAVILIDRIEEQPVHRWHTDPLTLELLIGKARYGRITRHDDDPLWLLWWPWQCRIEDMASLGPMGGAT